MGLFFTSTVWFFVIEVETVYCAVRTESLYVCLLLAQQPLVGQGLLIHEVSRSHTVTLTVSRTPRDE
jgi:hypothetical protein